MIDYEARKKKSITVFLLLFLMVGLFITYLYLSKDLYSDERLYEFEYVNLPELFKPSYNDSVNLTYDKPLYNNLNGLNGGD